MRKVLYIINPISGVGKQKIMEKLLKKYSAKNIEYTIKYTERAKHATEIATQNKNNFDAIIVVGGDGSVNEVGQALINTNTAFGIIPTGSGNGLARHLKIPLKIKDAINKINNYETIYIDTVSINNAFYINVAGIGFDALIAHKFAQYGKRGFSSYIKITASEFRHYKAQKIKLTVDNKTSNEDVFLLSVANGSQFGNNAYIAPSASINDGLLDITILNKFPLISAPKLAYRLFTRKIHRLKIAKTIKAKDIVIEQEGEILVHIDGEPIVLNNRVEINIIPNSLKIIV